MGSEVETTEMISPHGVVRGVDLAIFVVVAGQFDREFKAWTSIITPVEL